MTNTILSLLLCLQLLAAPLLPAPADAAVPTDAPAQSRLWWGLIDPELSAWFSRLPMEEENAEEPILWDWSWRGFLAALFGVPMEKEAASDAAFA